MESKNRNESAKQKRLFLLCQKKKPQKMTKQILHDNHLRNCDTHSTFEIVSFFFCEAISAVIEPILSHFFRLNVFLSFVDYYLLFIITSFTNDTHFNLLRSDRKTTHTLNTWFTYLTSLLAKMQRGRTKAILYLYDNLAIPGIPTTILSLV